MANQLAFKTRIESTQSLAKIFKAQEMIASSHIAKARRVASDAKPYSDAIDAAMRSLAAHTKMSHPIFDKKPGNRVAVMAITADRGMAGAYTSSIIRETEGLLSRLDAQGKIPQLYVFGRRGATYYKYRNRDVEQTWEGDSDKPGVDVAEKISRALLDAYMKSEDKGGVSELYIVFTEFINMVVQKVRIVRMLPIILVDDEDVSSPQGQSGTEPVGPAATAASALPATPDGQAGPAGQPAPGHEDSVPPLYSFEPSADEVLDAILPRYVQSRIHECLLTSAASETASRQNAMHTATDNAHNLIDDLTRKLNASRQASITQELTEIIGSADALNNEE